MHRHWRIQKWDEIDPDTYDDPLKVILEITMFTRTLSSQTSTSEKDLENSMESYIYSPRHQADLELSFYYDRDDRLARVETWNAPNFDVDLVKSWMKASEHEHPIFSDERGDLPVGFRLIDVMDMRVFEPEGTPRFIALSYVWHSPLSDKDFELDADNLGRLQNSHGIQLQDLPETVADCICLCRDLGERYLWVDRLCIVQDDASSKHDQISGMDRIYSAAKLTVICATDISKEIGIPGAPGRPRRSFKHNRSRSDLQRKQFPYLQSNVSSIVESSSWNKRCWTFQEDLFSPRRLYITDFQVVFACGQMICEEEIGIRKISGRDRKNNPLLGIGRFKSFEDYWALVRNYSRKHLSYETDILNAFAGIANALSYMLNTRFLFGLPEAIMPQALIWDPILYSKRRNGVPEIPSWSWAAWVVGMIDCPRFPSPWMRYFGKLIEMQVMEGDSPTLHTLDVMTVCLGSFESSATKDFVYGHMCPGEWDSDTGPIESLWRACPHNFWSPDIDAPIELEYRRLGHAHPGSLLFHTTVGRVTVEISYPEPRRGTEATLYLCDPSGQHIGKMGTTDALSMPTSSTQTFVVLSAGCLRESDVPDIPEWTLWVLVGLLVEKHGGVYRRLATGVAYVQVSLWHRVGPQWKTVVLV